MFWYLSIPQYQPLKYWLLYQPWNNNHSSLLINTDTDQYSPKLSIHPSAAAPPPWHPLRLRPLQKFNWWFCSWCDVFQRAAAGGSGRGLDPEPGGQTASSGWLVQEQQSYQICAWMMTSQIRLISPLRSQSSTVVVFYVVFLLIVWSLMSLRRKAGIELW